MNWIEWFSIFFIIFYIGIIIFWEPINDYYIYLADIKTYGKEVADIIWKSRYN